MAQQKQDANSKALAAFNRALKVDGILHELARDISDDAEASKVIETLRQENVAKLEELQDRVYPLLRPAG